MTTTAAIEIPGYVAGTWQIDAVHSDVSFTVRHMVVSKVKGNFAQFSGTITTAANPLESTVEAEVDMTSIETRNAQRDEHLRTNDFFDVPNHPTMTYRATNLRADGDRFIADGELTLRGISKQVPLTVEINGIGPDAYGGTRLGLSATAEINRTDFGVNWNGVIEAGGVAVSEKVTISLEIVAVLQQD